MMTTVKLIDVCDELLKNEKILMYDLNQDLEMCLMFADKLKCSQDQFDRKMEEAKRKMFDLEQRIRSLNIQLDEERENDYEDQLRPQGEFGNILDLESVMDASVSAI